MAREIASRRIHFAFAPRMLEYDKARLCWFIEERIDSLIGSTDSEKLERFLNEFAPSFYGRYARSRLLSVALQKYGITASDVLNVMKEEGVEPKFNINDSCVTYTFVHGDLSPGNMLYDVNGKFYLIDFEKMGAGLLALDLTRSVDENNLNVVLGVIDACASDDDLPAYWQMWIAACIKLVLFRKEWGDRASGDGGDQIGMQNQSVRLRHRSPPKIVREALNNWLKLVSSSLTMCISKKMRTVAVPIGRFRRLIHQVSDHSLDSGRTTPPITSIIVSSPSPD